jgi:chitin disaccharide deacetylase
MQRFFFVLLLLLLLPATWPGQMIQAAEGIRLIVRGDDIGSSHAANIACIQSYKEGIVRSVELMVPGPWFPEAVKMLNENPGLDVGIHLVLTSEWANMKWRPLSCVPSLVDADGYFFPSVWQNPNFPPNTSIQKAKWKLDEVEKELRAQIETALRHIPRISHLDCHMGCSGLDPSMAMVEKKLAQEYHLEMHWWHGIQFVLWDRPELFESSLKFYANILEKAKQVARAAGISGCPLAQVRGLRRATNAMPCVSRSLLDLATATPHLLCRTSLPIQPG